MSGRHVAVITGTRAEYGLLSPLMACIRDDPRTELSIIATGTHLEPKFGHTIDEIRADGFEITCEVPLGLNSDTRQDIADATAAGLSGMAHALAGLKPDIAVVLGDRYEIFAAAAAATLSVIPLAHIHGGETTLGAIDESMRHAISKMAHLHFAAADTYANRLIQMGETPEFVFNVGAPCLDTMATVELMSRGDLLDSIGIDGDKPFFLVTYHPETLGQRAPGDDVLELTQALDHFPEYTVIITGVNADYGNADVRAALEKYRDARRTSVILVDSLGYRRYITALHLAAAVVGNSSSGILETPATGTPTVNIGGRQTGRLRAASVIDCPAEADAISTALKRALSPAFRKSLEGATYPFGTPGAARRMCDILATAPLERLRTKAFHDLPAGEGAGA